MKLPDYLQAAYDTAIDDPEILSLRTSIALLDARRDELMEMLQQNSTPEKWVLLKKQLDLFETAIRDKNTTKMQASFNTIKRLVLSASDTQDTWDKILDIFESRRKMAEAERRRLVDMQAMVDRRQVMTLMAEIVRIIQENVHDKVALKAIRQEMINLQTRLDDNSLKTV